MLRLFIFLLYVFTSLIIFCALTTSGESLYGSLVEPLEQPKDQVNVGREGVAEKTNKDVPTVELSDLSDHADNNQKSPEKSKVNAPGPDSNKVQQDKSKIVSTSTPSSVEKSKTEGPLRAEGNDIESGAFLRGVWLFAGISFLFVVYLGIKTCRVKPRNPQSAVVFKYGVPTRRNDVEMEPLPLDDEEEETVFDLGNFNNRR